MKRLQKNNKGITLVALVITVIILLVLAGISIATLTGSGLFENARLAEQESKNAQELEEATLGDYENKIGEYINGSNRNNFSKTNYKTDGSEVVTNELLDGKPIYARYFETTISTSNWNEKPHNIENVDKIWIDMGNSYALVQNYYHMLPNGTSGATYRVNKTNVSTYQISTNWNGATVTLLLKYTKTTD